MIRSNPTGNHSTAPPVGGAPGHVRADMHVHSNASRGAATALLGLIGCPECLSPPEAVYDQARARGMNLVTLTDHDTIDGALELADRGFEGVFIGEEVSVRFPEGGPPVHVLIWGLTPTEHEEIGTLGLREDIYRLAAWVRERRLAHAVAHPLDGLGRPGGLWRLQRLALLFGGFEIQNGAHAGGRRGPATEWLRSLTPEALASLGSAHGIEPLWPAEEPRAVTAGSDDHGLLNAGAVWTGITGSVKQADTAGFLDRVRAGEGVPGGREGGPEVLTHQIMAVGLRRYAPGGCRRLKPSYRRAVRTLAGMAGFHLNPPGLRARALDAAGRLLSVPKRGSSVSTLERTLESVFARALGSRPRLAGRLAQAGAAPALSEHTEAESFFDEILGGLTAALAESALRAFSEGGGRGVALGDVAALALAHAPALVGMRCQHQDRWGLRALREGLGLETPTGLRVALVTDTLGEVNGVSRFVRDLSVWAHENGHDLHVFAFDHPGLPDVPNLHRVTPVWEAPMPGYGEITLRLPPLLPLLRELGELAPDVVHVSTPGPLGLTGALAGEILRTPVLGTHHTELPAYARRLVGAQAGDVCEAVMRRLYAGLDRVLLRGAASSPAVSALGAPPATQVALPAGVDSTFFHPGRRDPAVWTRTARARSVKILCAGRVSVEKNTRFLEAVWAATAERCRDRGLDVQLVVVGDGPDRPRLEASLGPKGVIFLGYRHGADLAAVYASCDVLLFPSVTDTLGQVVLEAQASGLPAVVSDRGGPSEMVEHGVTGYVLPAADPGRWASVLTSLAGDDRTRRQMGLAARAAALARPTDAMFRAFWDAHAAADARRRERTRVAEDEWAHAVGHGDGAPAEPEGDWERLAVPAVVLREAARAVTG